MTIREEPQDPPARTDKHATRETSKAGGNSLHQFRAECGLPPRGAKPRRSSTALSDFWTQANANFVDMAVLEWCKLLSDRDDKHHWRNIVTDPAAFKAKLPARLEMTPTELLKLVKDMSYYRNKFVAHLDSVEVMNVPPLSKALEAVNCYHEQSVTEEASAGDLRGFVDTAEKFAKLYAHCSQEARRVYSHAVKG